MLRLSDLPTGAVRVLVEAYGLRLSWVPQDAPIPGSYWGEPEAGIVGSRVFARPDTPVHSLLHEFCHAVCMDAERRADLHTDAGGDVLEENAVCYLQIVLADALPGVGRMRLMQDMDAWGYSFRLGNAAAWFQEDAEDARAWLLRHGLLDATGSPVPYLRQ